ncbi:MAG: ParB/RepB/Spo0J family partition protein [Planctomycetota bacterium]|nr:ParB/RepB/Spo0J family partition protein [Planctomycetota bacterium]
MSDTKETEALSTATAGTAKSGGDEISQLELKTLVPSRFQPRAEFDVSELEELAASLRASGVLQPILVRPTPEGKFEIICGERRWRAAQLAGLERIPALVRELSDETAAVVGLVENVQRTDLNAIEKARAFRRIQQLTQANQAEIAKRVGLQRSTVANMLRLLDLPKSVQEHVSRGTLSMGHARALLGLAGAEEQVTVAEEIIRKRLSVRQVEEFIQVLNAATEPPTAASVAKKAPKGRPVWVNEIEEHLVEALNTSVSVKYGRKRSKITIECLGREEFERVYELLKGLGGGEE